MPDDQLSIDEDAVVSPTGSSIPVVRVKGELDALSCGELRAVVDRAIDDREVDRCGDPDVSPPVVVVDLVEVTFCDSLGLGTLITLITGAARRGTSLRLVAGLDDVVPRLARRVALEDHLTAHVDLQTALHALVGSGLLAETRHE